MAGGRPTKYKPEMCQIAYEFLSQGYSQEATAGQLGICADTLFEWKKTKPEFSEAIKRGIQKGRLFWEQLGMEGVKGEIDGFNATTWIFNMKNRFSWADKQEIGGMEGKPIDTKWTVEFIGADDAETPTE